MTLQEQYNRIKEGKGSKHIFLTEAKKIFPNMLTNRMPFEEASTILKQRGVITENYVDLQPINTIEATPKTAWENKFAQFLAEEAKEENIKVDSKKTDKSVEETQDHNFDYKDQKNLDNQIGQEVLNGIYFEAKQNPDKSLDELRKIVSKNLEKDRQYYMKNAAFGIKDLGYQETEIEEVSGKYKASGYSDKLKKLVKESLVKNPLNEQYFDDLEAAKDYARSESEQGFVQHVNKNPRGGFKVEDWYDSDTTVASYEGGDVLEEDHTGNPNDKYVVKKGEGFADYEVWEGNVKVKEFSGEDAKERARAFALKKRREQGLQESSEVEVEKPQPKKMKKESLESRLSEIDKQGAIVALEAKIDMVGEAIEKKNNRISMVSEDENLSELVDKTKIKAMQKEVKLLEKQKAKMEKMYEKMCGKSYTKEVIDETYSEDE